MHFKNNLTWLYSTHIRIHNTNKSQFNWSLRKFMVNFFKQAIDHSLFLWWLNLNSSSALKIIGGDSNLPERKLIIKSLQHNELMMHMLDIKGEWISQEEIDKITVLVYSKFSPFNSASSQLKQHVKFSRQSFLALIAIYNICNIGLNYANLNKKKLTFKLSSELTEKELALLQSLHTKLSVIFKKIFEEENSELVQYVSENEKPIALFDNFILMSMMASFISGLYFILSNAQLNLGALLMSYSVTAIAYFYVTRTKAFASAFEKVILKKLHKNRGI